MVPWAAWLLFTGVLARCAVLWVAPAVLRVWGVAAGRSLVHPSIWPFRTILHPPVQSLCMFCVCHHLVVSSASVGTLSLGRGVFGVRQPPKTPAYVLHYSSFTSPSSGHKLYFVFHNRYSCQVPQNLKSLGSFRGLRAFVLIFCVNR